MAKRSPTKSASQGEWAAIVGYAPQYQLAAQFAITAIQDGYFHSLILLDPRAGQVDDFQIVTTGRIDAYQVKWESKPSGFTFKNLLELIHGLAQGRRSLSIANPNNRVVINLLTNCYASTSDQIKDAKGEILGSFYEFHHAILSPRFHGKNPLPESLSKWQPAISQLMTTASMQSSELDGFLKDLHIHTGVALQAEYSDVLMSQASKRSARISSLLFSKLLKSVSEAKSVSQIAFSLEDIVECVGLEGREKLRNIHRFITPSIKYEPILATKVELAEQIGRRSSGYIALVGPPGSGKSTLVDQELISSAVRFIRYYAFVPGNDIGAFLRGESDSFFHDLNQSFRNMGSYSARLGENYKAEFIEHLKWMGEDFRNSNRKTVVVIDGLDHISREQNPSRNLIDDLPPPHQLPDGVIFLLSTQPVAIGRLPAPIQAQLESEAATVEIGKLVPDQVRYILENELNGFDNSVMNRIFELVDGHPLSLALLVSHAKRLAKRGAEILDALGNEKVIFGDITRYYRMIWNRVAFSQPEIECLGLMARDRLGIRISEFESDLSAEGVRKVIDNLGHLWRIDADDRLRPFHNSFRLFLKDVTSEDSLGRYSSDKDRQLHAKLADRYVKSESFCERWEAIAHLLASGNANRALEHVTIEHIASQVAEFRDPSSLYGDLRVLMRIALEQESLTTLAKIAHCWNFLHLCELGYGESYPEVIHLLLDIGETETAIKALSRGNIPIAEQLSLAHKLLIQGREFTAQKLFEAIEPLGDLHLFDEPHVHSVDFPLRAWARVAPYFRRPKQVLELIKLATFKPRHELMSSNIEEIRSVLLHELGIAIIHIDDEEVIEEIDRDLRVKALNLWIDLRVRRINELNRKSVEGARSLAADTVKVWQQLPESHKVKYGLRMSELGAYILGEVECAKHAIKQFTLGRQVHTSTDGLTNDQYDLYQYFRLAVFLNINVSVDSIPINEEEDTDASSYLTRHLANFGIVAGQRMLGQDISAGMGRAFKQLLSFVSQFFVEEQDYRSYSIRASFKDIVLVAVKESDQATIQAIGDQIIDSFDTYPRLWLLGIRLDILEALIEEGYESSRALGALERVEQLWSLEAKASENLSRNIQLGRLYATLNLSGRALGLARHAVMALGTIEHEDDYQINYWCRFLSTIRNRERKTIDVDLISLFVASAIASAKVTKSKMAGMIALDSAYLISPSWSYQLAIQLAENESLTFAQAIGKIIYLTIREQPELVLPSLIVYVNLCLAIDESNDALIELLANTKQNKVVEEILVGRLETEVLPSELNSWKRLLNKHFSLFLDEQAESEFSEHSSMKDGDAKFDVENVCRSLTSVQQFREFLGTSDVPSHTIRLIIETLCSVWPPHQILQLDQVLQESDEDVSARILCATALSNCGWINESEAIALSIMKSSKWSTGEQWQSYGTHFQAMKLIQKSRNTLQLRAVMLPILLEYVKSGGGFTTSAVELFENVLVRICTDPELSEIEGCTQRFVLRITKASPDTGKQITNRELDCKLVLLDLLLDNLTSPVHYLAEGSRRSLLELIERNQIGHEDFQYLNSRIGRDRRKLKAIFALLNAASTNCVPRTHFMNEAALSVMPESDFVLRQEVILFLRKSGNNSNVPLKFKPLPAEYFGEPIAFVERLTPKEVDSSGYLEDSFDIRDVAKLILPNVGYLSRITDVPESGILNRIHSLLLEDGRSNWEQAAERDLRSQLTKMSLKFTFQRLRSRAVEDALHQCVAELDDAGLIPVEESGNLPALIRVSDPILLKIRSSKRPENVKAFKEPVWSRDEELWVSKLQKASLKDFFQLRSNALLMAERSKFYDRRGRASEFRELNLWSAHSAPKGEDGLLPLEIGSYATQYWMARLREHCIALRHFTTLELHGAHCEWLCVNAVVPTELGMHPDESKLFGWRKGNSSIWTIRWTEGNPLVHHESRSEGWMVLATADLADDLRERLGALRYIGRVSRKHENTIESAMWTEEF
jgi:hypothetical protein